MFKKTYRNIFISLMLTATLLTVLIVTLSSFIVSKMIYENYTAIAKQKFDRSILACKNYVNSVLLSVGNLAANEDIILKVKTGQGDSVTNILDNACSYALKINAITVYSASGKIYSSSNISGIPTLQMLEQNSHLNDFFVLETAEYVSLRTDNISSIYDQKPYSPQMGIVSCCRKIFDGSGNVAGYIFADIFPKTLYKYFSFSEDADFDKSIAYICFDDEFFISQSNLEFVPMFSNQNKEIAKSQDGNYLILIGSRNFFGGTTKIAVPLYQTKRTVALIILLLIFSSAIILVLVYFIAKKAAKKTDNRLENLLKKMENAESRLID